jgi:hypothetical protein
MLVHTLTLATGKRYMLSYILVRRLKDGQTTFYQSKDSLFLFEAGKPVRRVTSVPHIRGDDIWALVDGSDPGAKPHVDLLESSNVRIVMVSSPRTEKELQWLRDGVGTYFMRTWTDTELYLVGCVLLFFLLKGQPES